MTTTARSVIPPSEAGFRSERAKVLGAYYTDAQIANVLVAWAIRSAQDTVMDPSFGGGVFLRSACERLALRGGAPPHQVFGAEVDADAHALTGAKLADEFGIRAENLALKDFFLLNPALLQVDAIVGNPPFIRYQRFTGEARKTALRRAAEQGVHLTKLCSSWAPFLVHAVSFLKEGGRLAVVAPFELCHAAYARPVLSFLVRSFGSVLLATFRNRLFPDLSEDTLLILAENKGASEHRLRWREFMDVGELADLGDQQSDTPIDACDVDPMRVTQGKTRLIEYLLPEYTRDLYRELGIHPDVPRLGTLADVGIGYVTGANDYFHISPDEAALRGIPKSVLTPAIKRGRSLSGTRFTCADWTAQVSTGDSTYLLHIRREDDITESVREYIREGEDRGVSAAYKCRTRTPWYTVPYVHVPDGFLTYMSGHTPRLVANEAQVVAPNSLHILRLHKHSPIDCRLLATLWQTSLTRLSAEIEGHALGGGMLKVEPTEAERLLVPVPSNTPERLAELGGTFDHLLRAGDDAAVNDMADRTVLEQGLGLTRKEALALREAGNLLRQRRSSIRKT